MLLSETGLRAAFHPLLQGSIGSVVLLPSHSEQKPAKSSSKPAVDLRPTTRSNLEPSRHRLRRRQNPCPFLYLCTYLIVVIYIIVYTCCMTYLYLYPCLCRAFVPVYLPIYLYLSLVLWKSATPSYRLVSVAVCAFVLVVVDRAIEPVERAMCLNVTIANSSRHGRDAKHDPSLVL